MICEHDVFKIHISSYCVKVWNTWCMQAEYFQMFDKCYNFSFLIGDTFFAVYIWSSGSLQLQIFLQAKQNIQIRFEYEEINLKVSVNNWRINFILRIHFINYSMQRRIKLRIKLLRDVGQYLLILLNVKNL